MKNLLLNVFRYSPEKSFFLVLIGTFAFITPVSSTVQDEKTIGWEDFSSEMATIRLKSEEAVKDSLHQSIEFPVDSTPTVVGTSKAGRKDDLETTILFDPSGGSGWGSTSQVLP